MTEEEAKTKWCPAAKIPLGSLCIGSACMAWRWLGHRDRANHKTVERFTDIAEGATDQDLEAVGFCGLASRP